MISKRGKSHPAVEVFKRVIWFLTAHHQCTKLCIGWGVKYQHSPLPLDPITLLNRMCVQLHSAYKLSHSTFKSKLITILEHYHLAVNQVHTAALWIAPKSIVLCTAAVQIYTAGQHPHAVHSALLLATFFSITPLTCSPTGAPATPLTSDGHATTINFSYQKFLGFSATTFNTVCLQLDYLWEQRCFR